MRSPHGQAIVMTEGRPAVERDVAVCAHCQRIMLVEPGPTAHVGWCGRCGAPVCPACEAAGRCVPFERRLEQLEARERICRAAGIVG